MAMQAVEMRTTDMAGLDMSGINRHRWHPGHTAGIPPPIRPCPPCIPSRGITSFHTFVDGVLQLVLCLLHMLALDVACPSHGVSKNSTRLQASDCGL